MMMKGRSNSNASNSSFGNSFDQSPLSSPPTINDIPLYNPQPAPASVVKPSPPQQQQPPPPAVAPKPNNKQTVAMSNAGSEGSGVINDAVAVGDVDDDGDKPAAGPPLPSYNDIMKDIENKSPTPTTGVSVEEGEIEGAAQGSSAQPRGEDEEG